MLQARRFLPYLMNCQEVEINMPKIGLVTGCAGFIGSHLCERLLAEGWDVIGLDDMSAGNMENLANVINNKKFRLVKADVTKPEQIDPSIFKNVDCVFHHAGKKMAFSVKNPRDDLLGNVYGTLNMLMFAAENGAKKFIMASTIAVYGSPEKPPSYENSQIIPTAPYGVSKFACEEYCRLWYREHKLPVIIFRYASVYGPRQATNVGAVTIFITKILKGEPITIYGDGSHTRPFTYVEDVVRANIAAANSDDKKILGETFNVGANRSVSLAELVETISKKLKKKANVVNAPDRPGEIQHMAPDISKIKKMMKFEPAFSLDEGIAKTVE